MKSMEFNDFAKTAAVLLVVIIGTTMPGNAQGTAHLPRPPIHRYSFDGEGGVGAVLKDSIGNADGTIYGKALPKPLPYHERSATLVVIPDTENTGGGTFNAMTKWIADNIAKRHIVGVLHAGDITNNNQDWEWKKARTAFDFIEGKIPYVLAAGNHDYDHTPGRLTYMNKYFKVEDQKKWPTFGDVYEEGKLENHYQYLEINGQKWIVLSLEMGPRAEVVKWANTVLQKNQDRLAIILTHGYLCYNNERYDHRKGRQRASPYNFYGDGADGEMLWNGLVRKYGNVMMVICAHLSSAYVGYRKDEADHGNVVHQMLVDYEKIKGRGFMRMLEFLPDGKSVQVRTYSPTRKEINSPITKGEKPLHPRELEEFMFELQTASGNESMLAVKLLGKPAGKSTAGETRPPEEHARLNGEGRLVITSNEYKNYGLLDADLAKGRDEVSFEVWFTPTTNRYNWSPVVQFKGNGDAFYYNFRTFGKHRAELIDDGHNEKIYRGVRAEVGKQMHLVVTYDQDGFKEGDIAGPLLSSYVDGKLNGRLHTSIRLSELNFTEGTVGPFTGTFDELRIYDYPLSDEEVAASFKAGPQKLAVAGE